MSKRIKANVGTLDDMGKRFVSAWHRLEHGEKVRERHVTFPDLPPLLGSHDLIPACRSCKSSCSTGCVRQMQPWRNNSPASTAPTALLK